MHTSIPYELRMSEHKNSLQSHIWCWSPTTACIPHIGFILQFPDYNCPHYIKSDYKHIQHKKRTQKSKTIHANYNKTNKMIQRRNKIPTTSFIIGTAQSHKIHKNKAQCTSNWATSTMQNQWENEQRYNLASDLIIPNQNSNATHQLQLGILATQYQLNPKQCRTLTKQLELLTINHPPN